MTTRIPLTPYDRLFLAGHLALQQQGLPGHPVLVMLELRGVLDLDTLRQRFETAVSGQPLLSASIGYSLITGRAHWRLNENQLRGIVRAPALILHDFRKQPQRDFDSLRQTLLNTPLDPDQLPHVQLHHVQLGDAHQVLILVYGHYLMDLNGGWRLLQSMAEGTHPAHDARVADCASRAAIARRAPAEWSGGRVQRWMQGLRLQRNFAPRGACVVQPRSHPSPDSGTPGGAGIRVVWSPEQSRAIENTARERCTIGPMLYTRHAVIAAVQAVEAVRDSVSLAGDSYLVPVPIGRPGGDARPFLPMNDLTIATLQIPRSLINDVTAMDAEITRQLDQYVSHGGDEATWRLMGYAGWLRNKHYQARIRNPRGIPQSTVGVTAFRLQQTQSNWLTAQIESLSAHGLPTVPPGLMLTLIKCAGCWTLGASFFPHIWPRDVVAELVAHFAHRLGTTTALLQR